MEPSGSHLGAIMEPSGAILNIWAQAAKLSAVMGKTAKSAGSGGKAPSKKQAGKSGPEVKKDANKKKPTQTHCQIRDAQIRD